MHPQGDFAAVTLARFPARLRIRLAPADTAERILGLRIACPYQPCSAPAGAPCRRTDVTGARHETRLLHPVRINTAKRELGPASPNRPNTRRRALTTRGRPNATWRPLQRGPRSQTLHHRPPSDPDRSRRPLARFDGPSAPLRRKSLTRRDRARAIDARRFSGTPPGRPSRSSARQHPLSFGSVDGSPRHG